MNKKVLIIGSLGYLGSKLFKKIKKQYDVVGIDNHFFAYSFFSDDNLNKEIIKKDIRDLKEDYLAKFDVIILLAGISNDPLDKTDERIFYYSSLKYSMNIANICKRNGIKLIFPSSCSVYGFNKNEVDEFSETHPLTGYSKNKLDIENYLISITDNDFKPIILRFSTIYGFSPRMRFDVVINMLVGMAVAKKEIILNSDGQSWRPHLHIDDAISVIQYCIEFDDYTKYLLINVGQNIDNKKIIDVAKIIAHECKCRLYFSEKSDKKNLDLFHLKKLENYRDKRSYIVNFDNLNKIFKNFSFNWTLKKGINDLVEVFKSKELSEKQLLKIDFHRLQKLEYMYKNGIINTDLEYIKTK